MALSGNQILLAARAERTHTTPGEWACDPTGWEARANWGVTTPRYMYATVIPSSALHAPPMLHYLGTQTSSFAAGATFIATPDAHAARFRAHCAPSAARSAWYVASDAEFNALHRVLRLPRRDVVRTQSPRRTCSSARSTSRAPDMARCADASDRQRAASDLPIDRSGERCMSIDARTDALCALTARLLTTIDGWNSTDAWSLHPLRPVRRTRALVFLSLASTSLSYGVVP